MLKGDFLSLSQLRAFTVLSSSRFMEALAYTLWAVAGLLVTGLTVRWSLYQILGVGLKLIPAWVFAALAIYILNDLYDKEFDKMVGNERPLATGKVNAQHAKILIFAFSIIALVISYCVNVPVFLVCASYLVLGVMYSTPPVHLKKRILGKQFTLTSLFTLSLLAGGISVMDIPTNLIFMISTFGIFVFFMTPIPDLKDIDSDRKQGCKTLPLLIGKDRSILMGIVAFVILLCTALFGYLYFGFNISLIPMTSILVLINLRKLLALRSGKRNREDYLDARNRSALSGIVLPLLFIIGMI